MAENIKDLKRELDYHKVKLDTMLEIKDMRYSEENAVNLAEVIEEWCEHDGEMDEIECGGEPTGIGYTGGSVDIMYAADETIPQCTICKKLLREYDPEFNSEELVESITPANFSAKVLEVMEILYNARF